jgi:hypothetical protein
MAKAKKSSGSLTPWTPVVDGSAAVWNGYLNAEGSLEALGLPQFPEYLDVVRPQDGKTLPFQRTGWKLAGRKPAEVYYEGQYGAKLTLKP